LFLGDVVEGFGDVRIGLGSLMVELVVPLPLTEELLGEKLGVSLVRITFDALGFLIDADLALGGLTVAFPI
tara:strand:- start:273 stop:485 length:213 start_codon:yes stop_codon:yes gene_type:complete